MDYFFFVLADLEQFFGKYGEIEAVQLKKDPFTGRSRGFAFICFKSTDGIAEVSHQRFIHL